MREGKIDGTARCEHGDFSLLSSHWADLQRTMEGQGVRLAPLRESNSGSYSGQNSFHDGAHSQQQQQERNPGQFGTAESSWTPAAPAPKVSLETAVLEKTNSDQLLQMWV